MYFISCWVYLVDNRQANHKGYVDNWHFMLVSTEVTFYIQLERVGFPTQNLIGTRHLFSGHARDELMTQRNIVRRLPTDDVGLLDAGDAAVLLGCSLFSLPGI